MTAAAAALGVFDDEEDGSWPDDCPPLVPMESRALSN